MAQIVQAYSTFPLPGQRAISQIIDLAAIYALLIEGNVYMRQPILIPSPPNGIVCMFHFP